MKIGSAPTMWSCFHGASFKAGSAAIKVSSESKSESIQSPTRSLECCRHGLRILIPTVKVWIPYTPIFMPEEFQPDHHQSHVIARLKDKQSATAALKEVSALQYQIHMQNQGKPVAEDVLMRPMIEDVVENAKTPLIVLMCSVGCMLLIACLNVSNLLVARGAARRKEVAIRGALGGSRWKLIQEQMTESLLIAIAGGAVGWVLSISATRWLATHWRDLPRADAIRIDASVLSFSIVIVLLHGFARGAGACNFFHGEELAGSIAGFCALHRRQRLPRDAAKGAAHG